MAFIGTKPNEVPSNAMLGKLAYLDGDGGIVYSAITAATTINGNDKCRLFDVTSGTFTLSFISAANLPVDWKVYVRNSGTGTITLDPSGAETIDGLSTCPMYPNEMRVIFTSGGNLRSVVLNAFSTTFTSSGSFIKPSGYSAFEGFILSGGGGGNIYAGGGGGGGIPFEIAASALGATTSFTIGSGGSGVVGNGNSNDGGATSFGSVITVSGGQGAQSTNGSFLQGGGGAGFLGFVGGSGGTNSTAAGNGAYSGGGGGGSAGAAGSKTAAGGSVYGGGGGGSTNGNTTTNGGTSTFAGAGGDASSTGTGGNGSVPSGGGGAGGAIGGSGARGEIRIRGVI